jgi:HNH endonuclease
MSAEPGWCSVCGLEVPAGETLCRWRASGHADDGRYDDEAVPWASHSLAFMTELVEQQCWSCPWCGDELPGSPSGTAIDHIIPKAYGGPHRRWNLQLLHQECNSAKGKKITTETLELADAHGVTISMDVGQYHAGVRRRAVKYALRVTRQLSADARERAMTAARNLTVFFPEGSVHAVIRAAAAENPAAGNPAADST